MDIKIKSMQDLRPGDLFLGPIGGAAGVGVRLGQLIVDGGWRVGELDVRHIGVIVEASRTLPPGTVRHRESGKYYVPGEAWHPDPDEYCDRYETGVITAPRMVQAMPGGAEEIEMTAAKHWTSRCAYARIPEDWPGQAEDAAAIARLMVGIPYSWASYAALALYHYGFRAPRLTEWIGRRQSKPIEMPHWSNGPMEHDPRRPDGTRWERGGRLPREAICSVLADQAWSLAGKRVMEGTAPQAVTPSMLGRRLLMEMEGVTWGFPRTSDRDFLLS